MTAGTGHRRAAEAVAEALRHHLRHNVQVHCADLLAETRPWFERCYPALYWWLVRYLPSSWALGYYAMDHRWLFPLLQPWRRRWNRWAARAFLRQLAAAPPDIVLVSHFFSADVVASAKRAGRLRARLIVIITDLFPHRFWLVPEADAFVVGSELTRQICLQRGIPSDRLHLLGIPVGRHFQPLEDRAAAQRALGLDPARWTILIAGGGMGVGPIVSVVAQLLALEVLRPGQFQLLAVCGHNQRVKRQLDRLVQGAAMPAQVFGFVETMPQMMGVSDLMVTKAGGLSTMEALAMGLPMILCGNIPGQERLNAAYCIEAGAALSALHPHQVVDAVCALRDHPDRLEAMRRQARLRSRPHAAEEIVDQLVLSQPQGSGA